MKSFYLLVIFISLTGCDLFDDHPTFQKYPQGLPGTWQLVEQSFSAGGRDMTTQTIENGPLYHFGHDGSLTVSTDFDISCHEGTYKLDEEELVFTYGCDMGDTPNPFTYHITFEEDYMVLRPKSIVCMEGCSYKYKKILL